MIPNLLKKIFGSRNDRLLKQLRATVVSKINALEPAYQQLSDTELRAKTDEFKARVERVKAWMPCCRSPLQSCVKRPCGCMACAISMCR
jgi:preprotein translocase subunit SecA